MLDTQTLQQYARQLSIDEFTVLREYLQVRFLEQFYSQAAAERIFFKGGTAIKLLLGSNRFSEDLDFTNSERQETVDALVDKTIVGLKKEFSNLYSKKEQTPSGQTTKLYLPTDISRQDLTVKLDFATVAVHQPTEVSVIKTKLPVTTITLVKHLSRNEILAEKIRALWMRGKGRDLFDIWYLLHHGVELDVELAQQKLDLYNEEFSRQKLIHRVQKWSEKELDLDLRRFLPTPDRKIIPELKRLTLKELKSL